MSHSHEELTRSNIRAKTSGRMTHRAFIFAISSVTVLRLPCLPSPPVCALISAMRARIVSFVSPTSAMFAYSSELTSSALTCSQKQSVKEGLACAVCERKSGHRIWQLAAYRVRIR